MNRPGEVVTLRTGNEGPRVTQAQWLLEALEGGMCANQSAPQRASDMGLLRLVPHHSRGMDSVI